MIYAKTDVPGLLKTPKAQASVEKGMAVFAIDVSPAMLRIYRVRISQLRNSPDAAAKEAVKKSYCYELAFDEVEFNPNSFARASAGTAATQSSTHQRQAQEPIRRSNGRE
jgi:hypothetical protein